MDTLAELEYRGLAIREDYDWVAVQADVGELYLAYLAARICELQNGEMDPVTNDKALLRRFACDPTRAGEVRSDLLDLVLPAPREDVTPLDLVAFKDRYRDELKALRRHVEDAVLKVASTRKDARDQAIRVVKLALTDELAAVEARFRERGWSMGSGRNHADHPGPRGPRGCALG
jgi:hypothetical protein